MNPADFWNPFDTEVKEFPAASNLIRSITSRKDDRRFAWRGVADACWALHSPLYRRLLWTQKSTPTEEQLQAAEMRVVREAQTWGLHSGDRGRLSMFEFLATLQHYSAPTRFIDITFNPYIALFFATEDEKKDAIDGRIFAVEVTGRLLNGHKNEDLARWERLDYLPWVGRRATPDGEIWGHASYVWKPAGFDRRIAAQQGGFLLGGVPMARRGGWPKTPSAPSAKWEIDDVRRSTSVPTRPHVVDPTAGKRPRLGSALYSFRIKAEAKPKIRKLLAQTFDLRHATLFPDFPGFAASGVDWLVSEAPRRPS